MRKVLMALLMALPLSLMAQQKIGVINTSQVMAELPDVKAAQSKIEELAKKYDADIKTMQTEFQAKTESFIKEREKLEEVIRARRQQEIQDMEGRIQQSYQAMQEDLQKQQQQLMAPIQKKVTDAVKKVGDANGCTYVFEYGALLYVGADAIDLTQKVKDALNIKPLTATTKSATAEKKK